MTLPNDVIIPVEDVNDPDFTKVLSRILTRRFGDLTDVLNGTIQEWIPVLKGFTTAGAGTYTHQNGWYLRQGLLVDLWFDIEWSAHTGTGFAYIELPYKVKASNSFPFDGLVNFSGITLGAGYTSLFMLAEPNGFRGFILEEGSGLPIVNLAVPAAGRLFGHIRYLGQEFE